MANKLDLGTLAIIAVAISALYIAFGGQAATPLDTGGSGGASTGGGAIDLCPLVSPGVEFGGQTMFLAGTVVPAGNDVRIIKINADGTRANLGLVAISSGTKDLEGGKKYMLYYAENATGYYTVKEEYNAPCEENTIKKVGTVCAIDTAPGAVVLDEYKQVQSTVAATNSQVVAANGVKTVYLQLSVSSDHCYGNPQADKDNAVCFVSNSTIWQKVEANTGLQTIPYSMTAYGGQGKAISCYKLAKMKDTATLTIPVTLTAGAGEPTLAHNISYYFDDVDMDLNADDYSEIWDFQDEDNNALGAAVVASGEIRVS